MGLYFFFVQKSLKYVRRICIAKIKERKGSITFLQRGLCASIN
jgi:hypothetical protein